MKVIPADDSIAYYIGTDAGSYFMVPEPKVALFNLLKALGLKTIPDMTYTWTTISTNITMSGNSVYFDTSSHPMASGLTCTGITINEPKEEPKIKKKGFSRGQKQNWRSNSNRHSRSTGR